MVDQFQNHVILEYGQKQICVFRTLMVLETGKKEVLP